MNATRAQYPGPASGVVSVVPPGVVVGSVSPLSGVVLFFLLRLGVVVVVLDSTSVPEPVASRLSGVVVGAASSGMMSGDEVPVGAVVSSSCVVRPGVSAFNVLATPSIKAIRAGNIFSIF